MAELQPTTDGVVTIRPPQEGDAAILLAGRDDEFYRFMGDGHPDPRSTGCIVVNDEVVTFQNSIAFSLARRSSARPA